MSTLKESWERVVTDVHTLGGTLSPETLAILEHCFLVGAASMRLLVVDAQIADAQYPFDVSPHLEALDAELAQLTDDLSPYGTRGWLGRLQ